jgi:SRSO17 transposase
MGLISDIKRKTLPEIAKVVGLENSQGLDYFIGQSPWSAKECRNRRLKLILALLSGRDIILIIDETGDRKKGKTTDYVQRQYIGNLGKIENGIVAVTAYGVFKDMTFPLLSRVYKPQKKLKEGDKYKSKPQIAGEMIQELNRVGFKISLVLADSEYGESEVNFIKILEEEKLSFVLAIRSNHGVWMPSEQKVRNDRWRGFERVFSTGKTEKRYIREIIFGKRRERRYWEITDAPARLPKNSTWYVMTKIPNISYKDVGNLYGLRNWVEYGLKQSKNELGWADFRFTDYQRIEKWWEMVMSAYLMVSLQSENLNDLNRPKDPLTAYAHQQIQKHPEWHSGKGWKNTLNNLRLLVEPLYCFNLLKRWLLVIFTTHIFKQFCHLLFQFNQTINAFSERIFHRESYHLHA